MYMPRSQQSAFQGLVGYRMSWLFKDYKMTSNIIIAVMVQFILAIAPMDRSAAASDSDQDPDQLWSIGWDLSQDNIKQGDELRVKADRHGLIRERARILAAHQQSGLLQELM